MGLMVSEASVHGRPTPLLWAQGEAAHQGAELNRRKLLSSQQDQGAERGRGCRKNNPFGAQRPTSFSHDRLPVVTTQSVHLNRGGR